MSDVLTVLRKELREFIGNRASLRAGMIQPLIMVGVLGVMMPLSMPTMWMSGSPVAILYYLLFPGIVSAVFAADAFAGERERKTLETLLATPLSDVAIVLGKAAAAVVMGLLTATVAFELSALTINMTQHPAALFVPSAQLMLGALGAALGGVLATTAAAIFVSMRVLVARTAQQIASVMSLVVGGVLAAVWSKLNLPMDWPHVMYAEAVMTGIGLALFAAAALSFKRDRLLERR